MLINVFNFWRLDVNTQPQHLISFFDNVKPLNEVVIHLSLRENAIIGGEKVTVEHMRDVRLVDILLDRIQYRLNKPSAKDSFPLRVTSATPGGNHSHKANLFLAVERVGQDYLFVTFVRFSPTVILAAQENPKLIKAVIVRRRSEGFLFRCDGSRKLSFLYLLAKKPIPNTHDDSSLGNCPIKIMWILLMQRSNAQCYITYNYTMFT